MTTELKMYCVFSKESIAKMKGNRGKLAAQAGHAYLHAWWNSTIRDGDHFQQANINAIDYQYAERAKKVCLIVDLDEELLELYERYRGRVGTTKVVDAGFTVFNEPTLTCIGIGPIYEDQMCEKLKSLKVLL